MTEWHLSSRVLQGFSFWVCRGVLLVLVGFFNPWFHTCINNCLALFCSIKSQAEPEITNTLDCICGPEKKHKCPPSHDRIGILDNWQKQLSKTAKNANFFFPLNTESIFLCQKFKLAKPTTAEQLSSFLLKSIKCLSGSVYDTWHFTSLSSPMPFCSPLQIGFNHLECCFTFVLIQSALRLPLKEKVLLLPSLLFHACDHNCSQKTTVSLVDQWSDPA